MKLRSLVAALLGAGVLVACGGGGGGSDSAGAGSGTTTRASVTLTGVAAKGLMANADVAVYAVEANGAVASTPLVTTVTDSTGNYTLSFEGTKDQPYVVKVTAKADGSTTHLDEATGVSQALPASFSMRGLVVPAATGTVTTSASITPFSELAVAAAAKADGGITSTNAAQAVSTVSQLLGFDPMAVKATTVGAAASSNEQRLAVMLSAVSVLANEGGLGCSGSGGEKTQCVVQALASAATTTSIKLETSGGTDVSAALKSAVTTVLSDTSLSGSVGSTQLATVVANLDCGSSCTAAPSTGSGGGTTEPDPTATAISAAKLLISDLKSNWLSMFSRGGAQATADGAANQEAYAFKQAMDGANPPAQLLIKDVGAMLMGIDLYHDYMAGRTTVNGRTRGDSSQVDNDGLQDYTNATRPVGCSLFSDANASVLATSIDQVRTIGCSARYYFERSFTNAGQVNREWRHGFRITPQADGTFTWTTSASLRVNTCTNGSCTVTSTTQTSFNADGSAITGLAGTITPTLSAPLGSVTGFTVAGDLAAGYQPGTNLIEPYHHATISLTGTQTTSAAAVITTTMSGSLTAKAEDGSTVHALTLKPGSKAVTSPVTQNAQGNTVPVTNPVAGASYSHTPTEVVLNLVYTQPTAEFEGLLSMSDTVWDASGTDSVPTKATLSGKLRNIRSTGTTEFLTGTLDLTISGYGSYNELLVDSASNFFTMAAQFKGTISATDRPVLEVTLAASKRMDGAHNGDGTLLAPTVQYRTLVAGSPRLVVNISGDVDATTGEVGRWTLSEASSGVTMSWARGATSADLLRTGGSTIGRYTRDNSMMTFTDGSFVSLDFGL